MKWIAMTACVVLMACETSTDPADGGFFNGVAGITSGNYQSQIDEDEADVAAARVRNSGLADQISSSESKLARLKITILNQRNALGHTDSATSDRINRVLASDPGGARIQSVWLPCNKASQMHAHYPRIWRNSQVRTGCNKIVDVVGPNPICWR